MGKKEQGLNEALMKKIMKLLPPGVGGLAVLWEEVDNDEMQSCSMLAYNKKDEMMSEDKQMQSIYNTARALIEMMRSSPDAAALVLFAANEFREQMYKKENKTSAFPVNPSKLKS